MFYNNSFNDDSALMYLNFYHGKQISMSLCYHPNMLREQKQVAHTKSVEESKKKNANQSLESDSFE